MFNNNDHQEEHIATIAEADAEYARNVGAEKPDREWILSDRDVWYRNPFYTGVIHTGHPEDDPEIPVYEVVVREEADLVAEEHARHYVRNDQWRDGYSPAAQRAMGWI